MRYNKAFAGLTLVAGMALAGITSLSAQDWGRRDSYRDQRDIRGDARDLHYDHERVERLQADIARDHWQLNQDIGYGRDRAAAEDAADLARDQRALNAQLRDIHHDREDIYRDSRDLRHDYHERNENWGRRW